MSQALCLVDHATHVGHFAACPTNVVCIGSLVSRFRVAAAWCCTRCPCALCAFPFPGVRSALYPAPSFPVPDPPISLSFFLLLVTRSPACLPRRADPLSSPLFPPLPLTQEAPHVFDLISAACTVCVFQPRRIRRRCVAFPSPFASINTLGPCSSSSSPFLSLSQQNYEI